MKHIDDLRGASKLAVQATKAVTDLVQAMHVAIGGAPARIVSAPIYATIRGVTSAVGGTLDRALGQLAPLLGESTPRPERELLVAALNGVLGDYLAETNNPLAIEARLHRDDAAPAKPKIVVYVHCSSMNHGAWQSAPALDATPLHLHYNSGLHVSINGRTLDELLEKLVSEWPVPIESIAIVAHSMGGLVARSACRHAELHDHGWREKLTAIVFLATPHHGAPLERMGNWFETFLGVTRYSAPLKRLGMIRSAGVTDLRFGNVLEEDWQGRDRFERTTDRRTPLPLPRGVACYAIAAERDGLVPLASAMGDSANPELSLGIPPTHRLVVKGTGHIALLGEPAVWEQIGRWLA